jgi:hypothetical protein
MEYKFTNNPGSSDSIEVRVDGVDVTGSYTRYVGTSMVSLSAENGSLNHVDLNYLAFETYDNPGGYDCLDITGVKVTNGPDWIGGDIQTDDPEPEAGSSESVWNANANIGDNWQDSSVSYCVRLLIPGSQILNSGDAIKLGFQGRSSGDYTMKSVSIAERDQNGNLGDVIDSTWKKVTFYKENETYISDPLASDSWETYSVVVSAGVETISNPINFNIVQGRDYYVTFKIETPSVYINPPSGYSELYFESADHTQDLDWSEVGFGTTRDYHALSNIYITNEPVSPTNLRIIHAGK